jgi:hypothetical protein
MMKDGLYQHLIIQGRPVPPNMARRTKTRAHSVRFELTRGDPSRFRVCRLNRSATNALYYSTSLKQFVAVSEKKLSFFQKEPTVFSIDFMFEVYVVNIETQQTFTSA